MAHFRQQLLQHKSSGAGYTGATSKFFRGSSQDTGMAADTGGSAGGVPKPVKKRAGPGTLRTPLGGIRR